MIWFLHDLDLLAVLLRAVTLGCEALLLGGVAFLLFAAAPAAASEAATRRCRVWTRRAALGFMLADGLSVAITVVLLAGGSGLSWRGAVSAPPTLVNMAAAVLALALFLLARWLGSVRARLATSLACAGSVSLVGCAVFVSHAASRLEHRPWLTVLTGAHHAGTALWVGAMPFLLLALRTEGEPRHAAALVRRYSAMALTGAALLVGAGAGLSWFYVGAPSGLYGTAYGLLLLVKIALLLGMVGLGAANWRAVRAGGDLRHLRRLRSFAEVEIAFGFLALLVAASLTAQPPAVDVGPADRLSGDEIRARFRWEAPRLASPPLAGLAPPAPIQNAAEGARYGLVLHTDDEDRAWSEYNHHWAGIAVLLAGLLAMLSRVPRLAWARYWPAGFGLLAIFLFFRADPECWPLGTRPFWRSFYEPDVLVHRLSALLIVAFAFAECGVQSGRLRARTARYLLPALCGVGASLLLIHSHGLSDAREELLTAMSHSGVALVGLAAGAARWLEVRLPAETKAATTAGRVWPVALALAGILLLEYREG